MVLPLMRYLQLQATQDITLVRYGLGAGARDLDHTFAILGTYSRAGLVALGVGGFFSMVAEPPQGVPLRRRASRGCRCRLIRFMPEQWKDRMQTIDDDASPRRSGRFRANGRLNAWKFAWNLAKDRPLVGGGFRVLHIPPRSAITRPDPNDLGMTRTVSISRLSVRTRFSGVSHVFGDLVFHLVEHTTGCSSESKRS